MMSPQLQRGSSARVAKGYVLDGRGSFLDKARYFSLQTGSEVHPVSYPIDTGGSFSVVKEPGREADHHHLVPRLRTVELYLHSPVRLHGVVLN
jgi:hypothetical protein